MTKNHTSSVSVIPVTLPMKTSFGHASQSRSHSSSVIVALNYRNVVGFGEAAPRPYVTGETISGTVDCLKKFFARHLKRIEDILALHNSTDPLTEVRRFTQGFPPNVECAVFLAIVDWCEKASADSCKPPESSSPLACVPVMDGYGRWSFPPAVRQKAPLVKIKALRDPVATEQRIRAVRSQVAGEILVDANNAWQGDESIDAVRVCLGAGASWFEEPAPVRAFATLSQIRKIGARVLLDESVCTLEDLREAHKANAIDGVNIRIAKCGGPVRAAEVARAAEMNGIERYYGVQVAEVGSLIPAGRRLSLSDGEKLGVEAGQADLFFEVSHLWVKPDPVARQEGFVNVSNPALLKGRRGVERVK